MKGLKYWDVLILSTMILISFLISISLRTAPEKIIHPYLLYTPPLLWMISLILQPILFYQIFKKCTSKFRKWLFFLIPIILLILNVNWFGNLLFSEGFEIGNGVKSSTGKMSFQITWRTGMMKTSESSAVYSGRFPLYELSEPVLLWSD